MKNLKILILFLTSAVFTKSFSMEQGAAEARELKKTSKIGQEETLDALIRTLKSLDIFINLNGKTEQKIFAFTDSLIKKGPTEAKLVRNMIQKYAQLTGKSDPQNYTYSQFKLDIMNKIVNEKSKGFKKYYPDDVENQKLSAAFELKAYFWSQNEAKKNLKYQKTLNKLLLSTILPMRLFKKIDFVQILKLGANSFDKENLIIIKALLIPERKNIFIILQNILEYDKHYDQKIMQEALDFMEKILEKLPLITPKHAYNLIGLKEDAEQTINL